MNGEGQQKVELVAADFRAGESGDPRWGMGVLNQERRVSVTVQCKEGLNTLGVGALEAGMVLERVVLYKKGVHKPENYMGPDNSYLTE